MKENNLRLARKGIGARFVDEIKRNYILYILAIPVVAYFVIFCYLPMFGLVMAFKDYKIMQGIWGSEWTGMGGFEHFHTFLSDPSFISVFKNTILISLMDLVFGFPAPVIFASSFSQL